MKSRNDNRDVRILGNCNVRDEIMSQTKCLIGDWSASTKLIDLSQKCGNNITKADSAASEGFSMW
jgi:hypothetical protein